MKKRLCVFICQPLTPRSQTENHAIEYLRNVRRGIVVATQLIKEGFAVYCPALDLHFWLSMEEGPSAEDIYEQDLSLLSRMDAVVALPGYVLSPNCMQELNFANELRIPVFMNIKYLREWRDNYYEI